MAVAIKTTHVEIITSNTSKPVGKSVFLFMKKHEIFMTPLQERLFAMQDEQYAAFQAKLTPGVPEDSIIGIRVPVLRKFAKEFAKKAEVNDFVHQLPHKYYDENMLHSLLISQVKDYEECIS